MPESNDPLGVTIGAREIYDQVVGLRDDVRSLTQTNAQLDEQIDDHEQRLRAIERWKYAVPAGLLTGVSGAVVAFLKTTGKA
ncbi:hypothetical protein AB0G42_21510 [Streptomyces yangpuensis]|uniref:hypothetical protein n=1 Tax=Streptomyces yangpuensis TaxID=1648182 RepID=UPI00343211EE